MRMYQVVFHFFLFIFKLKNCLFFFGSALLIGFLRSADSADTIHWGVARGRGRWVGLGGGGGRSEGRGGDRLGLGVRPLWVRWPATPTPRNKADRATQRRVWGVATPCSPHPHPHPPSPSSFHHPNPLRRRVKHLGNSTKQGNHGTSFSRVFIGRALAGGGATDVRCFRGLSFDFFFFCPFFISEMDRVLLGFT